MESYIKRLSAIITELEKEDSLSIEEILKMDMYAYKNELVERAGKILRESEGKFDLSVYGHLTNRKNKNGTFTIFEWYGQHPDITVRAVIENITFDLTEEIEQHNKIHYENN